MLLVGLIITWVFLNLFKSSKKPQYVIVENVETFENDVVCDDDNMYIVEDIKEEILHVYDNGIGNKREMIIELLTEMQDFYDPGEFLDQFPQIHHFIFDRRAG